MLFVFLQIRSFFLSFFQILYFLPLDTVFSFAPSVFHILYFKQAFFLSFRYCLSFFWILTFFSFLLLSFFLIGYILLCRPLYFFPLYFLYYVLFCFKRTHVFFVICSSSDLFFISSKFYSSFLCHFASLTPP